jgi:ParB family chromosome partitioning protein
MTPPATVPAAPKVRRGIRLAPAPSEPANQGLMTAASRPADPAPDAPGYRPGIIYRIALDDLAPDPAQPRQTLHADPAPNLGDTLATLGASLAVRQEVPLIVRHTPTDENPRLCTLVDGERRYLAARAAGLNALNALLDDDPGTGAALIVRQAVTNQARAPLSPLDWALTFARLRDAGLGPTDIADQLTASGLPWSRPAVSNHLRLLDLPPWGLEALRAGTLTVSHALTILSAKDHPAVLDNLHARIKPHLTRQAPAEDTAAPGPARKEPPPAKLTVERLQKDLHHAIQATAVDLLRGGTAEFDGEPRWLPVWGLLDEDRADCPACPSRIQGDGREYCGNPTCLRDKIETRQAATRAADAARPPPGPNAPDPDPDPERERARATEIAHRRAAAAAHEQRVAELADTITAAPLAQRYLLALYAYARDRGDDVSHLAAWLQDPQAHTDALAEFARDEAESLAYEGATPPAQRAAILAWLRGADNQENPA